MYSTRYSCQILKKIEFYLQIFRKYSNIKFHENPSCGSRAIHTDIRTDRNDEANSRFSQLCERAPKPISLFNITQNSLLFRR